MSMEQLLVGALEQVANHNFGNSILELGVHTKEGRLLAVGLACLLKGVVGKLSIITVNAVLSSKLLECLLGKDGLGSRAVNLEIHKKQLGVVAHKNGAVSVPLLGEWPLQLGKKTTLVDSIWSTETISPGLVATNTS